MYAIYEKSGNHQLSLFEDEEEFLDLNEAEEILRQLQRENPTEYERIANLPHGIRTARFSLKKGLIVFCEAFYPNHKDWKGYQQLYWLDERGEIVSKDSARILGMLKSTPEEAGLPLPKNYNQTVMQVKVQFAQEVQHRQSEREYGCSLTQAQRYVLRELELLFQTTKDEEIRKQINLLDQAFRQPMTTVLKRELNLFKRKSLTGVALFAELKKLYAQHEMGQWLDRRRLQGEEQPISLIVCSQAFL